MIRNQIFEAFEELESLTTRARAMSYYLDDHLTKVMQPTGLPGDLASFPLDRDMLNFARAEVAFTCDTLHQRVRELHDNIRAGWEAEDKATKKSSK